MTNRGICLAAPLDTISSSTDGLRIKRHIGKKRERKKDDTKRERGIRERKMTQKQTSDILLWENILRLSLTNTLPVLMPAAAASGSTSVDHRSLATAVADKVHT